MVTQEEKPEKKKKEAAAANKAAKLLQAAEKDKKVAEALAVLRPLLEKTEQLGGDGGEFVEQGFLRASAGLGCGRLLDFQVAPWPAQYSLRDSSSREGLRRSDGHQEQSSEASTGGMCL